jgi:4-amino-4-deoxy-L-arabinose transferase-like glycosyltransferase
VLASKPIKGIGKACLAISSGTSRRTLLLMVGVALVLRLTVMAFVYPERLNPARDYWRYGGEAARIARSIVEGKGFSNPYFADTGPTAWLTPVFPYLLAGVFKIFGAYTKASALVILSLDCLFSALTCIPVFFIARKSFGEHAALWAGWLWAFFPLSIYFAADFIWDTALATLLLPILFLIALHLEDAPGLWRWAGFGAFAGFAALSNPVSLSVAPFLALWLLYGYWKRRQRWFAPGAAALLGIIVVLSPWFARNYHTFNKVIPLRSGFWFEVYCGNNADSWHWDPPGYHPSDSEEDWSEYQRLGEIGYMDLKGKEARAFLGAHKRLYAVQTLRRIVYIWTGFWSFSNRYLAEEPADPPNTFFLTSLTILALLGLRRAIRDGIHVAMPYLIVFVFFPLVYYLTHPEDYYRRPMDPFFVILAAYAITSRVRSSSRAFSLARETVFAGGASPIDPRGGEV